MAWWLYFSACTVLQAFTKTGKVTAKIFSGVLICFNIKTDNKSIKTFGWWPLKRPLAFSNLSVNFITFYWCCVFYCIVCVLVYLHILTFWAIFYVFISLMLVEEMKWIQETVVTPDAWWASKRMLYTLVYSNFDVFAFCSCCWLPPWIFSVVRWTCGSYHELCKLDNVIGGLIYHSFRGHGLKMIENVVVKG